MNDNHPKDICLLLCIVVLFCPVSVNVLLFYNKINLHWRITLFRETHLHTPKFAWIFVKFARITPNCKASMMRYEYGKSIFTRATDHWWMLSSPNTWWRHQMETRLAISTVPKRYWPLVRGILRSPVNSPHKGQWRAALMFSLVCTWTNGWVNNGDTGDLRRHRAQYHVTVMTTPQSLRCGTDQCQDHNDCTVD